eukprot:TRINITY_DN2348_c0_g1_i2.p1 TRINITY_DN2348_c0_g1~~TRINITY_DN2348_c0_g1_i2.p1  ORF type:complete len:343 (+),score=89.21 TRINITY_DN2348_c0_g1_i2:679-1707(+)
MSAVDAALVLECIRDTTKQPSIEGRSVLDLLQEAEGMSKIVTFSPALDKLLGGGISVGCLTEICGVPGIGKTQLLMQLAINVQIPESVLGFDADCLFVDTEGSFTAERTLQMSQAMVDHLSRNRHFLLERASRGCDLVAEDFLKRIHFVRIHDLKEFISFINMLPHILNERHRIRLVVIDSIAMPFRYSPSFSRDFHFRGRLVQAVGQVLADVSRRKKVAIVVSNHATPIIGRADSHKRRISSLSSSGTISSSSSSPSSAAATTSSSSSSSSSSFRVSELGPALGDSWGQACSHRLFMYWKDDLRCCQVLKSPTCGSDSVMFDVTSLGIRDVSFRKRSRPLP